MYNGLLLYLRTMKAGSSVTLWLILGSLFACSCERRPATEKNALASMAVEPGSSEANTVPLASGSTQFTSSEIGRAVAFTSVSEYLASLPEAKPEELQLYEIPVDQNDRANRRFSSTIDEMVLRNAEARDALKWPQADLGLNQATIGTNDIYAIYSQLKAVKGLKVLSGFSSVRRLRRYDVAIIPVEVGGQYGNAYLMRIGPQGWIFLEARPTSMPSGLLPRGK